MNNEHNFETDTKLFQIRFHNVYMGEVWAADASSALSKAQSLYPDAPKHLFEIYIRAAEGKPSQSFMFKDVAELAIHLDAAYVQQPYDEYSAQPLSV